MHRLLKQSSNDKTMTREEVKVEFAGLAHDHLMVSKHQEAVLQNNTDFNKKRAVAQHQQPTHNNQTKGLNGAEPTAASQATTVSTIAILRRHPMYDSLVLVKRFRACLGGHTLEFPTTSLESGELEANKEDHQHASDCCKTKLVSVYLDGDDPIYQSQEQADRRLANGISSHEGEVVYVPVNGLLDRLDNYDKHGISIDSRVYAFAMGLKTAEKFLTSSSMKEIQETPPL